MVPHYVAFKNGKVQKQLLAILEPQWPKTVVEKDSQSGRTELVKH